MVTLCTTAVMDELEQDPDAHNPFNQMLAMSGTDLFVAAAFDARVPRFRHAAWGETSTA